MLKRCTVRITFSVHGIVGRETYEVEPGRNAGVTEARAVGALEWDMIRAGLRTFECGCCVNDDATVLATEIIREAPC